MRDKTASIELSSIARRYYEVKRDVALRVTISQLFLTWLSQLLSNQSWKETYIRGVRQRHNRYEWTLAMTWRLQHGYRMMEKWECEFAGEKRENCEMHNFLENHSMLINSRPSRGVFWWPYGKYHNPIQSYRYGENTMWTCVLCIHTY